ncbi:hypothetical protein [Streptomyces sp. NPDC004284]|uniref:hypothetical protein n=1 Tax=Streptomyces sp. NPDC004284 TaxID=3364695 RepID=UPI0036B73FA9
MAYGSVVHDPTAKHGKDLPLARETHERLAATVPAWTQGDGTVQRQAETSTRPPFSFPAAPGS